MPHSADIFYRHYPGDGEGFGHAVILLHGGGSTHMGWPSELRRIRGQNIYALDLPGHGKSKNPACFSMAGLVDQLHGFINRMHFFHVILAGFSLGGALAVEYAKAFPARIKALALISAGQRFLIPEGMTALLRAPADLGGAVRVFSQAAFHASAKPPSTPAPRRRSGVK